MNPALALLVALVLLACLGEAGIFTTINYLNRRADFVPRDGDDMDEAPAAAAARGYGAGDLMTGRFAAPIAAALLGALAAWLIILRPVFRLLREARS
jgi:hypothetical protein